MRLIVKMATNLCQKPINATKRVGEKKKSGHQPFSDSATRLLSEGVFTISRRECVRKIYLTLKNNKAQILPMTSRTFTNEQIKTLNDEGTLSI
ncbi:hypothetical protein BTO01_22445 [Vibrio jasicida]|nr:hypothetical protein BTO01_22445 [Vibrio jasicida]